MSNYLSNWTDNAIWANDLSESEAQARVRFVKEYLIDRNATKAALRCGYASNVAHEYGTQFLQEPYVQYLIAEKIKSAPTDALEDSDEFKLRQIENALFEEAFYKGPGSSQAARVAALKILNEMKSKPKEIDDGRPKGGVMIVPMIASSEQWEQMALTSQAILAEESIKDVK